MSCSGERSPNAASHPAWPGAAAVSI